MISHTTARFRKHYENLPKNIREQAREAYKLFQQNPNHPSLRFKRVQSSKAIYSARISRDYRALGLLDNETIVWFWIGTHSDYDKLLSQM